MIYNKHYKQGRESRFVQIAGAINSPSVREISVGCREMTNDYRDETTTTESTTSTKATTTVVAHIQQAAITRLKV